MAKQRVRTAQVATRYTEPEHELIAAAAKAVGQEFGPFVRAVAVPAARAVMEPADMTAEEP